MSRIIVILAALVAATSCAAAQNIGGVFGPKVTEGRRMVEYRIGIAEPGDELGSPWVQRALYEHAFEGRVNARIEYQWRDPSPEAGVQFDHLRVLALVEAGKLTPFWTTGFRFDARVREGDRPNDIGVHWTNQFDLSPRVRFRAVALNTFEFGGTGADRLTFETRASLFRSFDGGGNAGVELFNNWGNTADPAAFNETRHEVAPVVNWALGGGFTFNTSLAFGISEAAPDLTLRLRLSRRL